MKDLLSSEYWRFRFYQSFEYEWQPTLFQPVGGMDKIVDGFVNKIGSLIQYNTKVLDIQISDTGVTVVVEHEGQQRKHRGGLLHQQHSVAAAERQEEDQ